MVNPPAPPRPQLHAPSIRRPILFRGLRLPRSRITVTRPLDVWGQQMTSAFRVTSFLTAALATIAFVALAAAGQQVTAPATAEGDFVVHNFQFHSGESLPEVRLHYTTLGKPVRDAEGRTTNAVLILHGTGGSGQQFLQPYFAGELFGPGQLLDPTRYFIILPDGIGHGKSSKPSDA